MNDRAARFLYWLFCAPALAIITVVGGVTLLAIILGSQGEAEWLSISVINGAALLCSLILWAIGRGLYYVLADR